MRKYIELEDSIKKVEEHILPDFRGKVRTILSELPTIEVDEDVINGFREGQKDMLMFLLEGMKDALEKARMEG